MPTPHLLKLVGIVEGLLLPIQKVIALILPDFVEEDLKSPEVRNRIVILADKTLIRTHPEARLVPKATRRRLISRMLDVMLDDILLADE